MTRHSLWLLTVAVALPLAALAAAMRGFAEIPLSDIDAGDLMARFWALVLIALIVERAVEIYMVLRFGPREEGVRLPTDSRPDRARVAQMASFALGLCVALVGLRVLGQFLPTDAALPPSQLAAFRFVDVIVTTLVLAGGAEGMHRIARRLSALK